MTSQRMKGTKTIATAEGKKNNSEEEEEEEEDNTGDDAENDNNEEILEVDKEGEKKIVQPSFNAVSAGDMESENRPEGDDHSDATVVATELAEPPFGLFDIEGSQDFLDQELCKILDMTTIVSSDIEGLMWILKLKWIPRLDQNKEYNLKR